MAKLAARREPIDVVSLGRQLEDDGALNMAGGLQGVTELADRHASTHNAIHHAHRVQVMAGVRRTVELAMMLAEDGRGPEASQDPIAWIEQAAHRLAEAGHVYRDDFGVDVGKLCETYIPELQARKEGKRDGVMTGFPDLDALCLGLKPGNFVVVQGSASRRSLATSLATRPCSAVIRSSSSRSR
jgi:replicative DNA helicase